MLTETEIAALDDDVPISSPGSPPLTSAPPGASTQQVEAGMQEAKPNEERQKGQKAQYPETGSRIQSQGKGERASKVGELLSNGSAHATCN